jgi:penicillin-binding protein 2
MRPPVGQSQHGVTPFQVRLVVLCGLLVLVFGGLGWRLSRLTADDHWLIDAEDVLYRSEYLATGRGSIFDRAGRPLAVEVPSWTFEVHYEAINGDWAMRQGRRDARRAAGRDWSSISESERYAATAAAAVRWEKAVDDVWAALVETGRMTDADVRGFCEEVRSDVGRLRESVWTNQIRRLEKAYPGEALERFKKQPIAEETGPKAFHEVAERLDETTAMPLIRAVDRLELMVRDAGGDPGRDPAFRVRPGSHRDRGCTEAVVVLDRSTLPGDLRNAKPLAVTVRGVASTIIGGVRDRVTREDVDRRPFSQQDAKTGVVVIDDTGYSERRPYDLVGSSGIELEFDRQLHGSIGFREENRSSGELVEDRPPVRGDDLTLAIDVNLQARLRAILDPDFGLMRSHQRQYSWTGGEPNRMILPKGTPLQGAAVVLDIRTGEVLAVVSTPVAAELDLDERDYRLMNASTEDAASLSSDDRARREALIDLAPFRNRAIATEYPPGSIVKPLMYVGGVQFGRLRPDEVITCNGHNPRSDDQTSRPRCWGWRPERNLFTRHGAIGPVEAIAQSCNVYFYELAYRLGPERVHEWYRACGLEDPPGPGLGAALDGTFRDELVGGDVDRMIIGIGQGPVAWTPLHAATAYARLAMGGAPIRPVMVRDEAAPTPNRGNWNPVAVRTALDGMLASATEGTAARVTIDAERHREPLLRFTDLGTAAPTVRAKTGTAQVAGKAPHGWYAGLVTPAGATSPRYAFAVIVEHGNSGGAAAGPVANQLIRALAAEGYLGAAAKEASGASQVEWRDAIPEVIATSPGERTP